MSSHPIPAPAQASSKPNDVTSDGSRRDGTRRDGTTARRVDPNQQYRAHGRELWARFYALCCDRDLAWEALQHAFMRLLQLRDRIHNPRAWLLRVGSNWLADAARSHRRRPVLVGNIDHLIGPAPEPATRLLSAELANAVRDALSQLSTGERNVLVLRYALDWDTDRIADSLDLTPDAVYMRLSRARRHLGKLLTKDENHEKD